jgi:hypothetical protein
LEGDFSEDNEKSKRETLVLLGMNQGKDWGTRLYCKYNCLYHGIFNEEDDALCTLFVPETVGKSYSIYCTECLREFLQGKRKLEELSYYRKEVKNKNDNSL